ncbi:hypothetical protein BTIS_0194 [Bifidobacterium tissieri]|uniref:Uncharacterized protein n=1 Tax=Bifidobacterium tissieri TaxID=1630162 RepID=A0A261FIQ4_9BIFI|nr:hypothetical protein [Bifidobacterium tissieri]OZG59041.1 hypothetical protein BTIS_0194 [Bifidobacterium tissieri]
MTSEQQTPRDAQSSQASESSHSHQGHIEPGRQKATMLGLLIAFAIRRQIQKQCHADLKPDNVERLIEAVEEGELNQSIIRILRNVSQEVEPVPAALAMLLTHEDPTNKPFELHEELATEDEKSLAVGFCVRMNVALHGTEKDEERELIHKQLTGEHAASHRCEIIFHTLSTIRDLLKLQEEIDRRRAAA